jgi:outer membrane protein assembly factor BamB
MGQLIKKQKLALAFLLALTASVALLPFALAQAVDDWPMFRQNPQHIGVTQNNCTARSAVQLWNFSTKAAVRSSPAVADGVLVVGCKDNHVYCLNSTTGSQLWAFQTGGEVDSSPAIYRDLAYVGCDDGWVYCLNISSGQPQWISSASGVIRSSPAVVDGKVYIGSAYGVCCFSAMDGCIEWVYPTSQPVDSSPAVEDGAVYVNANDLYLYKLDGQTGKLIWRIYYPRCDINSPAIQDGRVYVGSYYGEVTCIDADSHKPVWQCTTQDTVASSAALAYGCVYVGSEDGCVYCFNAVSGERVWKTKTGYWVWSSPAIAGGCVYVGSQDYLLYCLDAYTGEIKWTIQTQSNVDSSPCIVGDVLYFGSFDHHIYAYQLTSQEKSMINVAAAPLWTTLAFDIFMVATWTSIIAASAHYLYQNRQNWKWRNQTTPINIHKLKEWFQIDANLNAVCLVAIIVFAVAFYINVTLPPLWAADEKTYSQVAYHMVKSGDYFMPWSFGEPAIWIGKPPLLMWLIVSSYQVFGASPLSTRIWMPLFGVLSLIAIFYLGKKLFNRQVGLLSVLVLGTFWTFFQFASRAMTDGPLLFFMLASIYFSLNAEEKHSVRLGALSGAFFGLALITKQFEAILIPLILAVYYLVTNRSIRFLITKRFTAFWVVAAAFFLPWVGYMAFRFSDFMMWFLDYNNVSRFTTPIEGHEGGSLFYFQFLFTTEFWAYLLPFAGVVCIYQVAFKRSKPNLLLTLWVLIVLGVFTFAQTKLYWYILPAIPAFALAIANLLSLGANKLQKSQDKG